jgi:hypothetical protein
MRSDSYTAGAAIVFRRYDTDTRFGYTWWGTRMAEDLGLPYYHIHCADDHVMFRRLARAVPGVRIWLGVCATCSLT